MIKTNQAFTLVELLISLAIFAIMTALLVAKYGTFNQGILLTNLAYDIALTLRTAQSYGLNVKSAPSYVAPSPSTSFAPGSGDYYSDQFDYPYGVHFDSGSGANQYSTQIIFFADFDGTYSYSDEREKISVYTIKRGSYVESICLNGESPACATRSLDVVFKRPDPDAIINGGGNNASAVITVRSNDGGSKKVIVRRTGQIAVSN